MSASPPHLPDPRRGRAETPAAFIRAIVLAYRKYGRDPCPALTRCGIAHETLVAEDGRVTAAQMELMSWYAMRELDDEALGWFSRPLPWGSYGLLCRASLAAPTLRVALKRWCRHHRLLTPDLGIELHEAGGRAEIRLAEQTALGGMRELCLVTSLRYVLGYACWVVDSRIPLLAAGFPYPAPEHAAVYEHLFCHDVRFAAPGAWVRFDAHYLDLVPCRDEAALQTMLQRALLLTVRQYRRDRLLVETLRTEIRRHLDLDQTADTLAARLNLSVRSLHRQLREEGATLQGLKDDIRREQAVHLLRRTHQPIKQIAYAVGYRNEKSFIRAFRSWTGSAPGTLRAGGSDGRLQQEKSPPGDGP